MIILAKDIQENNKCFYFYFYVIDVSICCVNRIDDGLAVEITT